MIKYLVFTVAMACTVAAWALTMTLEGEDIPLEGLHITKEGRVTVERIQDGEPSPPPPPPPPAPPDECGQATTNVRHFLLHDQIKTTFRRGDSIAVKFRLLEATTMYRPFAANINAIPSVKLMTVSKCPGDFNVDNLMPKCVASGGETGLLIVPTGHQYASFACIVDLHRDYYINIRNASKIAPDLDTCPRGETCGFVLDIRQ